MERYPKGDIGIKKLDQKCHVSYNDIQKWRDAYQEHGVEVSSTTYGSYTSEFKVSVVEYMYNTGKSIRKTASHFNIPSGLFLNGNASNMDKEKRLCLKEQRGRKSKMQTKRPRKPKINIETNEDSLAKVQHLCIENEFLKKLNDLIQTRGRPEAPIK